MIILSIFHLKNDIFCKIILSQKHWRHLTGPGCLGTPRRAKLTGTRKYCKLSDDDDDDNGDEDE